MKLLRKALIIVYSIYALLVFVALTFIVLPFVIVASFFGKIKGGNFIYKVCRWWGFTWYFFIGIRHKNIYESPPDPSAHYIFVANHISYMDIPPAVMAIKQPLRVLGKYETSKIPVFGYIYSRAVVMVDRSSPERRAKSVRTLKSCLAKGISIFIFPEGTFNETPAPLKEFFDGAFRIAIETSTNIKPVLFIDTLERLHYKGLFNLTPGPTRAVFLDEVPVQGYTMKDINTLKQNVYNIMDAGLRRYRTYNNSLVTTG